jgi:murein DD-endopeptidase MepM/ murein hydrolase activator NlpD
VQKICLPPIGRLSLLTLALAGCEPSWWNIDDDPPRHTHPLAEDATPTEEGGSSDTALPDWQAEPLTVAEAYAIAVKAGVDPQLVVYADLLPQVVSETAAELHWGFIEQVDAAYFVTLVHRFNGLVLEQQEPPEPNVQAFIDEVELDNRILRSSTPNTYDSFPWNWRLPMESGSFYLTCGYGCGAHTGGIYYSTDWANGSSGHLLESPASCWVIYTTYSASYGNQVIAECGDAGSGKRYYYRVAHMQSSALVTPGWWIGKGRDLGSIGSTGYSSGPHVHYETVRATGTSGSSFTSGEDLPINDWPTTSDSICSGDFTAYSFVGSPYHYITVQSDGCP